MPRLYSHPREYRKIFLANFLCIGFVPGGNFGTDIPRRRPWQNFVLNNFGLVPNLRGPKRRSIARTYSGDCQGARRVLLGIQTNKFSSMSTGFEKTESNLGTWRHWPRKLQATSPAPWSVGPSVGDLNGTRFVVHAGNSRHRFFAVFSLFLACCWEIASGRN